MKTIWKFPLAVLDKQRVGMPEGAEILAAQFQGSSFCLWAMVNTEAPIVYRLIEIFGTGHTIWDDCAAKRRHIATAQQPGLPLVWHVFERLE